MKKMYKRKKGLAGLSAICLMLIFSAWSCSEPVVVNENSGTLFIIGGGSRPADMVERMITEAGLDTGGYAVILPMSSSVPDSAIIWASEQFLEQGMDRVTGLNFESGGPFPQNLIDSLVNASLVYISGGDQNRFMEIVYDGPVMAAIHQAYEKGAVIAGTSAGAAVMSEKMITGDELRYPEYRSTYPVIESENLELAPGLGLIKTAIIDQHFVWRSRHNRLITAVLEHPELPGIGIDESTAIVVKGNKAEVIGESQVLVYRNPAGARRVQGIKLGGKDLRLDIYLPGDEFTIK